MIVKIKALFIISFTCLVISEGTQSSLSSRFLKLVHALKIGIPPQSSPSQDIAIEESRKKANSAVLKAWSSLGESGSKLKVYTPTQLVMKGIFAGSFIGIGGTLAASVGFDFGPSPWSAGNN